MTPERSLAASNGTPVEDSTVPSENVTRRGALRRLGEGGLAAAAVAVGLGSATEASAQGDGECWFHDPKAVQDQMGKRGSEQLMACWFGEKTSVDSEHLKRTLELAQLKGVERFEWFPLGIPVLEAVIGTFRVQPEVAPEIVRELIDMAATWRHWEVFPYGMPFPEFYEVAIGARGEFPEEGLPR